MAAIESLVRYSVEIIEHDNDLGNLPTPMLAQARRAAHIGLRQGILIRRLLAGQRRLIERLLQEAAQLGCTDHKILLEHLRNTYRPLIEHIATSLENEYEAECERLAQSPTRRRTALVERLLTEDIDEIEAKELGYEVLTYWHVGVILSGPEAEQTLQRLRLIRARDVLAIPAGEGTLAAWLGGHMPLTALDCKRLLHDCASQGSSIAIGDPGYGLQGMRSTHQEAQLAMLVARHHPGAVIRCADVLPEIAALRDPAIIDVYKRIYITPLNQLPGEGRRTRAVLRAYTKHGRAHSSAAEALGIDRSTVEEHVKRVRQILMDPLNITGLEIALRLEELGYMSTEGANATKHVGHQAQPHPASVTADTRPRTQQTQANGARRRP